MEDNKFQREVLDRLVRLETKIDLQDYKGLNERVTNLETKGKEYEQKVQTNTNEINELKSINKWIITAVIGAIVAAIINILVKGAW